MPTKEQKHIKHSQKNNTSSIRFIHFNDQWNHQSNINLLPQIPLKTNRNPQNTQPNQISTYKSQQRDLNKNKKHFFTQQTNQVSNFLQNSQLYPKKKAFSQLQAYKKLDLQHLRNRLTKPRQNLLTTFQNPNKQQEKQEEKLIINSAKLKPLKLPQIKSIFRQNQKITKIKLSKLQKINISERIKTTKIDSQNRQNHSPHFQVQTGLIKNNNQTQIKHNKRLQERHNPNQADDKLVKKEFDYLKFNQNPQIRKEKLKQQNKNKSYAKQIPSEVQNIHNLQQKSPSSPHQNQAANQQKQETSLPKLQVYDKKMKIGRKKKKQEDRIRAMLIKTLQKTKGTQYIAQQGTSQKKSPRNSRINTQRSSSKQVQDNQDQRHSLVLVNDRDSKSSPKKSIQKAQVQKLKKSLMPKGRLLDSGLPSGYTNNKKLVEMVREVQSKKKYIGNQLEEIKQERSQTKQDETLSNMNQQNDQKQVQQQDKNQFLSHDYRIQISKMG